MPGQRKLRITTNRGEYGSISYQVDDYTCDWYEFQGTWVILHNAWVPGEGQAKTYSINNAVTVEER